MERLSPLINRIKERHEAGCSQEELLVLVDQLKNELMGPANSVSHSAHSVSVMMPAGYHPVSNGIMQEDNIEEVPVISKVEEKALAAPELVILEKELSGLETAISEMPKPIIPKPSYSVLRPPRVAVIEEKEELQPEVVQLELAQPEEETPVIEKAKPEPSLMDDILGFLNFSKPEIKASPLDFKNEKNEQEEKPLVYQLNMNEGNGHEHLPTSTNWQPERHDSEEVATLEMPQNGSRKKELHEILAARVVAAPSPQPEGKKMLADTLGGTRITDLRKGIAVNDRFRFIKSLFRGDEMLFDRSIKTINNFNILTEAQYWIQRELVIKLGWNDEDELVQQFYSLVNRRFL